MYFPADMKNTNADTASQMSSVNKPSRRIPLTTLSTDLDTDLPQSSDGSTITQTAKPDPSSAACSSEGNESMPLQIVSSKGRRIEITTLETYDTGVSRVGSCGGYITEVLSFFIF